jgi:hypothetical protein
MLPIIFYNLVQHVVAGCVNHWAFSSTNAATPRPA